MKAKKLYLSALVLIAHTGRWCFSWLAAREERRRNESASTGYEPGWPEILATLDDCWSESGRPPTEYVLAGVLIWVVLMAAVLGIYWAWI